MSIPKAKKNEKTETFMLRCLADVYMFKHYKHKPQRVACFYLQIKKRDETVKNQKP